MRKLIFSFLLTLLILPGQPVKSEKIITDDLIVLNQEKTAALSVMSAYYEDAGTFMSPIYEAKFPFDLLGLAWAEELPDGTAAELEIRFKNKKGVWSDWSHIEEDQDGAREKNNQYSYIITENSTAFQYKAELSTKNKLYTPKLKDISFDYISGGEESFRSKLKRLIFSSTKDLISRDDWEANEDLRLAKTYGIVELSEEESDKDDYSDNSDPEMEIVKTVDTDENGESLLWPLEYPKEVKKIVIHHTASNGDVEDATASLRAIYQYHAITRGWGDIGYNFIIDQEGNVYEGRYGGDGVVGGHAYGYNTGSVGIALLGNFENEEMPAAMMKSLTGLIYEKAEFHGIDPDSSGKFRGEVMQNILGHRDLAATACPGTHSYDYLPSIREAVGEAMDKRRHTNFDKSYSFEEVGEREILTFEPQDKKEVTIKLKNTGTVTWDSNTYLKASSSTVLSVAEAKMKESSVAPGETATFVFKVSSALNGGLVNLELSPVFNGIKKVITYLDLSAFVERPLLKFDISSGKVSDTLLKIGETAKVTVKLKNTGNLSWSNSGENAVKLVQSGNSELVSGETLATMTESDADPGETGTFEFEISAPKTAGKYSIYYAPEISNSNALVDSSGSISIKVIGTTEDASITDVSDDLTFEPGEKKSLYLQIENYSDYTWKRSGSKKISFGLTKSTDITVSELKLAVKSLAPGSSSKVNFTLTAPEKPGTYTVYIRPRLNGKNLTNSAYNLKIKVEEDIAVGNTADSYENPIRVKLTPGEITPLLSSQSAFSLYDDETLLKNFSAKSRVRVAESGDEFKVSSGTYSVTVSGPLRFIPEEDGIMQILNMVQRPAWNPALNDNSFRGLIEIRSIDSELTIINELPLEDYLRGIGEVSNGDPTEKIKTMIVLARSYAYYYMTEAEKFAGMPYHLDDDPDSSQKYLGYGYETRSPNVSTQVEATESQIVTYNGKVVKTPYFSSSDGVATKSAEDVWGWTNTPWLISVDDSICTDSTGSFEGHGVGLSGCGATEMAISGKTYDEIIRYYYTGVDIGKL